MVSSERGIFSRQTASNRSLLLISRVENVYDPTTNQVSEFLANKLRQLIHCFAFTSYKVFVSLLTRPVVTQEHDIAVMAGSNYSASHIVSLPWQCNNQNIHRLKRNFNHSITFWEERLGQWVTTCIQTLRKVSVQEIVILVHKTSHTICHLEKGRQKQKLVRQIQRQQFKSFENYCIIHVKREASFIKHILCGVSTSIKIPSIFKSFYTCTIVRTSGCKPLFPHSRLFTERFT